MRTTDPLRWLRAVDRRHSLWCDGALAALVAAVSLQAGPRLGPGGLVVLVAVHAAVVVRRRRPLAALAAAVAGVVLAAVGALVTGTPPPWTYLAAWVLLYTVALHDGRRRAVVTTVAVVPVLAAVALLAPPSAGPDAPGERLTLVVAVAGTSSAALLLGLQVRARRQRVAAEQSQIARAAAVAERARIAHEMHDVIGHNLSLVASLAAGGGVAVRTSPDDAVRAFAAISEVSRESVREVRRVLRVLRHDASDDGAPLRPQPGLDDLPALAESVRAAGTDVTLRRSGDLRGLDAGRQLVVYRVVQESLTNALRHAGPHARALVSVGREPGAVVVTVTDTGGGSGVVNAAGHGIAGMRERVEAYGGELDAGPAGDGWRVRARVPARDVAAEGRHR